MLSLTTSFYLPCPSSSILMNYDVSEAGFASVFRQRKYLLGGHLGFSYNHWAEPK
jgi:hypothetical protein